MKEKKRSLETGLIHEGEIHPFIEKAITLPIFQSSTFEYAGEYPNETNYENVKYIRLNNTPNHKVLGDKIAFLENTEKAVVTSSGMSAISTALLAMIDKGEHLISQENLYGGTHHFLHEDFPRFAREASFFNADHLEDLEKLVKPNTKGIYVEAISNPLLKIPDLKAIAAFAKKKGLISFIDNTFPSPYNFSPADLGFDVILHSATKYLNGHSDIVAGAIASSKENFKKINPVLVHLGGSLDPHACFLLHRGIKTLALRMQRHNQNAEKVAQALQDHPRILKVYYPGLSSEKNLAKELGFRGFGGMVSFEYKGEILDLDNRLKKLKYFALGPSLGGVESLATRPATTSHSGIPKTDRERLGIKDSIVRLSIGIENPEDLIQELFEQL